MTKLHADGKFGGYSIAAAVSLLRPSRAMRRSRTRASRATSADRTSRMLRSSNCESGMNSASAGFLFRWVYVLVAG
jgi:hypothetical protein